MSAPNPLGLEKEPSESSGVTKTAEAAEPGPEQAIVKQIGRAERLLVALNAALKSLWKVVKESPWLSATAIVGVIAYFGTNAMAYWYPGRTIDSFYEALNSRDFRKAWELFLPALQRTRWHDDRQNFEDGFNTTIAHQDLEVSCEEREKGWLFVPALIALSAESMRYDVSVTVQDRFAPEQCRDPRKYPEQVGDCLWLRAKSPPAYEQFLSGSVTDASGPITSLSLTRFYKKTFTLTRTGPFSWKISDISTYRAGIEWSPARQH